MEEENIKRDIISHIEIKGIWGKTNISWSPDPHVNILAGINGSGKTTLINILEEVIEGKISPRMKDIYQSAIITFTSGNNLLLDRDSVKKYKNINFNVPVAFYKLDKISTFDIPNKSAKKSSTQLDSLLKEKIYGNGGEDLNFIKLDAINNEKVLKLFGEGKSKEAKEIQAELSSFFEIIDSFFIKTGKKILFTPGKNFRFEKEGEFIKLEQLSAGEKQLLIILFSVYLQQGQPYIMLMDEPEISLHIEWQSKLIDTLLAINPNIQLIIATHSPSIFGKGWGDKFVNILDLTASNG